jgi:nitroreductase
MAPEPPLAELLEGLATTRAIRSYTDEPIPDDDLNTIIWHAGRAPSGSNRQPFRFLVLRDGDRARAAKALLGRSFRAGWAAKQVADGYAAGSGADSDSPKARQAATMQHYVDHLEEVPVVVLVCLVRYRDPSPYEGASVYPACQNLLLAARALGYGGALTMWHLAVEADLRALLEIPAEVALSASNAWLTDAVAGVLPETGAASAATSPSTPSSSRPSWPTPRTTCAPSSPRALMRRSCRTSGSAG